MKLESIIRSQNVLDFSFKSITSDKNLNLFKIITGIALLALGVLALTNYYFNRSKKTEEKNLADRKIIDLQGQLNAAIESGDVSEVNKLLKDHPDLAKSKDISQGDHANEGTYISLLLPKVIEKGNLGMVKCLMDNGAQLDAWSRGNKSSLQIALESHRKEVIIYLLEKGAKPTYQMFHDYVMDHLVDMSIGLMLVNTFDKISSKGQKFSSLMLVASSIQSIHDVKGMDLLLLMIQKGDRLTEADKTLAADKEISEFIDEQIKLASDK
ncbi:MAG: hypothetical protein H0W88_10085 [Parachlamydiaceae bacterium]|nr:hypothetical protein [Parachlamydiaceae bacterium]